MVSFRIFPRAFSFSATFLTLAWAGVAIHAAAPVNDNFVNRIPLTGTNLVLTGDNSFATRESGEPSAPFVELTSTVWYSWTAETNGIVYFSGSATNPDFAFNVGAYHGSTVNSLSNPSSTLDGGILVEPGEVIQLQVSSLYNPGGAGGGTGPFTLNIEMLPRAPASAKIMLRANQILADRVGATLLS